MLPLPPLLVAADTVTRIKTRQGWAELRRLVEVVAPLSREAYAVFFFSFRLVSALSFDQSLAAGIYGLMPLYHAKVFRQWVRMTERLEASVPLALGEYTLSLANIYVCTP